MARKNSQTRGEVCADTTSDNNNNTPGVDLNQQYREWKQMMVAATAARERAEQEKQVFHRTILFVYIHTYVHIWINFISTFGF